MAPPWQSHDNAALVGRFRERFQANRETPSNHIKESLENNRLALYQAAGALTRDNLVMRANASIHAVHCERKSAWHRQKAWILAAARVAE
jgi:hypothetical protein